MSELSHRNMSELEAGLDYIRQSPTNSGPLRRAACLNIPSTTRKLVILAPNSLACALARRATGTLHAAARLSGEQNSRAMKSGRAASGSLGFGLIACFACSIHSLLLRCNLGIQIR